MRAQQRQNNQLRPIKFTRHYTKHAEGSVLVEFGDTKVLCNATVSPGVPRFLKGSNQGWLTAEYGMLPRATHERTVREVNKGKPSGRTHEIQRLIGRCLRQAVHLSLIGENTITIDCDVLQADGGTRTASISGACVALYDCLEIIKQQQKLKQQLLKGFIASVSVGIHQGQQVLDLDYVEDSNADTDMNIVMTEKQQFIEVQGTAEKHPCSEQELLALMQLAKDGIAEIITLQKAALEI